MRTLPRLHLVTDDRVVARACFNRTASALAEAAPERIALHLRAPATGGRRLYELALELLPPIRHNGSLLLVNDRADVAMAVGADGVQLGMRGLAPDEVRPLVGPDAWIGASVHGADEGRRAIAAGADYLLAGTLFPSASHPESPGTGPAWLNELTGEGIRVIGIGGITPEQVSAVRGVGAHGVAVLGAVWNMSEPTEAVRRFLEFLEEWEGSD